MLLVRVLPAQTLLLGERMWGLGQGQGCYIQMGRKDGRCKRLVSQQQRQGRLRGLWTLWGTSPGPARPSWLSCRGWWWSHPPLQGAPGLHASRWWSSRWVTREGLSGLSCHLMLQAPRMHAKVVGSVRKGRSVIMLHAKKAGGRVMAFEPPRSPAPPPLQVTAALPLPDEALQALGNSAGPERQQAAGSAAAAAGQVPGAGRGPWRRFRFTLSKEVELPPDALCSLCLPLVYAAPLSVLGPAVGLKDQAVGPSAATSSLASSTALCSLLQLGPGLPFRAQLLKGTALRPAAAVLQSHERVLFFL